ERKDEPGEVGVLSSLPRLHSWFASPVRMCPRTRDDAHAVRGVPHAALRVRPRVIRRGHTCYFGTISLVFIVNWAGGLGGRNRSAVQGSSASSNWKSA